MDKDSEIQDALNRLIRVYKNNPKKAQHAYRASAIIENGMTCQFTQGEHSAVMDMPESMGGGGSGPTPGFFARAGIAGCVSVGIKAAAIMAGLAFDRVAVDIETDFDDGAALGLGTASAAPLETRLLIRIDTDEAESAVTALVDKVLTMDPWFLALRDAQSVKFDVVVGD